MSINTLISFFMWCTIIDGSLLIFWTTMVLLAPELIFRIQSRWISFPRETFDVVMYSFLAAFKIVFIVFNLVPYVALLIVR